MKTTEAEIKAIVKVIHDPLGVTSLSEHFVHDRSLKKVLLSIKITKASVKKCCFFNRAYK